MIVTRNVIVSHFLPSSALSRLMSSHVEDVHFYWLLDAFCCICNFHWRSHQTFPTVVSLKGRLPQNFQSKSTLSCEIVQIHSLFHHGFYKETEIKNLTEIENRRVFCSSLNCDTSLLVGTD